MLNSPLEDRQIKVIRCPYCGYESRKTLAWTHGRAKLQCAGCGEEFTLHKQKTSTTLNAVIRAFGDFRRKVS
jgi:DNA-directed RNA polymerase subunit RPC12/RpoP